MEEVIENKTKYICLRCNKNFKDSTGLTKHITMKKVRCDNVIDTDYWLVKQIAKIHERYKYLIVVDEIDLTIMPLDEKKKILKAFYLKTCNILKIINDNLDICPSIKENDIQSLKVYIQNCKTGDYTNKLLNQPETLAE